jgi:hypothetical protein
LRNLLVVIPGPATRASGVTLTSIEAFEDALVVNWRRMVEGDGEQPFLGFGQASLTDDVGTDYVSFGGGGGGSTEQYGTIVFGPAPPKAATTLELQIADDAFRVDLSARTVA